MREPHNYHNDRCVDSLGREFRRRRLFDGRAEEPTARVRDHLCVEISFEKSVDISQSSRNPLIFSQSLRIFQLIPSRRM